MAKYYSVPVTAETFSDTWQTVDNYRIQAKKRRLNCLVTLWAGGITFLALLLIGTGGLLYEYGVTPFYQLLRWLPYFEEVWMVMGWLHVGPGVILWDFLSLVLMLYWITMVVMVFFYVMSQLIYQPKARPVPKKKPKENASGLLANAREAMEAAGRIHTRGWFAFPFTFFLVELGLLILCVLVAGDPAPILKRHMTPSTALNYMLLFLISTGGFTAIYGLLVYALWCFCRVKLSYAFVADIECYSFFADEKNDKLTPSEVLANRKNQAAEKCKSALSLEKAGTYSKATAMFLEAAHGGNVEAMEHYARHCLVSDSRVPAEYWLRRCVATGAASKNAKKMLRRLRLGRNTGAAYLKDSKDPKESKDSKESKKAPKAKK